MSINYNPQTWANDPTGNTPLDADRLNYVEAGLVAIDNAKGDLEIPQAVKSASFTATVTALYPLNSSGGAFTVTLPNAPANGRRVSFKLIVGGNTVTIAAAGSDVFNKTGGSTTLTLSRTNQLMELQYAAGIWYVVNDSLSLTDLNSLYIRTVNGVGPDGSGNVSISGASTAINDWAATTALASRQPVLNPISGALLVSKSARTTSSTFDATEKSNFYVPGNNNSDFSTTPEDNGIYSWSMHPYIAIVGTLTAQLTGRVYLIKLRWNLTKTVQNLYYYISTVGSGLTAGQNFVGLYSGAGVRLAVSPDQTSTFSGSTGMKTATLSSGVSVPADPTGFIYMAVLSVGTTPPVLRGMNPGPSIIHFGAPTTNHCFYDASTAQTSLPSSVTVTAGTGTTTNPIFAAVGP